ncbi:RNA pseudouridine synthase 6 chloroplastic [Zea mays]|uniref:RNA pseudouridine synthase 6 chloroplastic n=1 Tax=Zea mays TaxID=4577 RepID=A0A1D6F3N3_MAIZE|nr:RNA pseudouridine synthase 6 chloroplastic [Zea mays]
MECVSATLALHFVEHSLHVFNSMSFESPMNYDIDFSFTIRLSAQNKIHIH